MVSGGGLLRASRVGAGLCWPMLFLGQGKFSTFLFVPYRMSFFLVTVNILLFVHDADESLFKKKTAKKQGISETALEIVMKNSELEILIKIK